MVEKNRTFLMVMLDRLDPKGSRDMCVLPVPGPPTSTMLLRPVEELAAVQLAHRAPR
jgi:hypothetical protein